MKILILEDEFLLADLLETELTEAGHTVLGPVATVAEGLTIIEETTPDLALVDINLRDGPKGTVLARELAHRHGILSLFVSGQMLEARQHKDVAIGYISKPYRPSTILAAVELADQIMNGKTPQAAPRGLELFPPPPPRDPEG